MSDESEPGAANSVPIHTAATQRASSPAKRSAAEMEDGQHDERQQELEMDVEQPTPQKEAEKTVTSLTSGSADNSDASSSNQQPGAASTATTGPEVAGDVAGEETAHRPSYDEQVRHVMQIVAETDHGEGNAGYLIANAWLERVFSRTSENVLDNDYPKEAREGEVGPIDNKSIQGEFKLSTCVLITLTRYRYY